MITELGLTELTEMICVKKRITLENQNERKSICLFHYPHNNRSTNCCNHYYVPINSIPIIKTPNQQPTTLISTLTNQTYHQTNNVNPHTKRTNLSPNNCIPNYIYWLNQPSRASSPYIYPYHSAIYKPKHSHPPMSRSRNSRLPTQTKKFFSPLLTARNPHLTNSHTNHHRNYQPIYSTDSTSSTTNSKHYSRPSINASNRRSYSSTYRHQPTNRYNYIYYSTSTYST